MNFIGMNTRLIFSTVCAIAISLSMAAQEIYELDADQSSVSVDGSSTLRNWSAEVKNMEGEIKLDADGKISEVSLSFEATTMDGGRGADMNKKIYKALKVESYPAIQFQGGPAESTDGFDLASEGELSIAGESKSVLIQAKGSIGNGIEGSTALKLSEFQIEPPTAMFGQIVCHDDITVVFNLKFRKRTL